MFLFILRNCNALLPPLNANRMRHLKLYFRHFILFPWRILNKGFYHKYNLKLQKLRALISQNINFHTHSCLDFLYTLFQCMRISTLHTNLLVKYKDYTPDAHTCTKTPLTHLQWNPTPPAFETKCKCIPSWPKSRYMYLKFPFAFECTNILPCST